MRLQRAAVPHPAGGHAVRPRTELLRPGLDLAPPARTLAYYLNEEEVPQSGTRLTVSYNRTPGRDGQVAVRLGARRGAGRGEASSGLAFDHLVDTSPR
ncbi:hypothetical protein [Streptomyces sp. DSM 41634]|uniref:hypothetical protein n=1 Tax=Streptomyces sp. DSM 41634 TaxID=3448656 RepID=UPI002885EAAD|nr:hypothetical protein [Streptomyces sp. DSM 41633]